ncbi:MAG: endopeptidase La [Myxococcota bacterium]
MRKSNTDFKAPASPFPLLPLRRGVLFPGTAITLPMGRKQSLELVNHLEPNAIIGVGVQRDPQVLNPGVADLFPVGTYARVRQIMRNGSREARIVVEGLGRFTLENVVQTEPYWMAAGKPAVEVPGDPVEASALAEALVESLRELGSAGSEDLADLLSEPAGDPGLLADRVASALGLGAEREIELLLNLDIVQRLRDVAARLAEAKVAGEVKSKIDSEVRKEFTKGQREAILREQLRAIKKELGDEDEDSGSSLRRRIEEAGLPDEAKKVAERELARLEGMNQMQAEHGVIRNYLELIASLPWSKRADGVVDIAKMSEKLDADHFGLDDVKKRLLEHLAVLKVTGNTKATILCLFGPPGVGKTSLGQSVADALGRPFVRVALGGVRDEAEIRGHRRTYVGALPGRVLHALKTAKVKNPVFLLDEIDKMGVGWGGSPEAALLEVLDPEQNKTFQDHYLELPFDLSEVLFICTANQIDGLSAPLRDRLEIIELSGYTLDEKFAIAKKHLIPKALKEHGIAEEMLSVSDDALRAVVGSYTREAGVRQLQRQITKLCRALVLELERHPEMKSDKFVIAEKDLSKYLGKIRFFDEVAERTSVPGVATGLAWTPVGGSILFIETSRMRGKGRIEITGQLGDVMKESARAALSYVRSNAEKLGVDPEFMDKQDLHIHIPAGGVPKDGPSAGVTMFTALTSLLTGSKVRSDTAMTGEVTLRGRVLPVGGIKEKVLAAHRAGMKRVILPKKNERDIDDVPEEAKKDLTFFFAEDMSEVLAAALDHDAPMPSASNGDAQPPALV